LNKDYGYLLDIEHENDVEKQEYQDALKDIEAIKSSEYDKAYQNQMKGVGKKIKRKINFHNSYQAWIQDKMRKYEQSIHHFDNTPKVFNPNILDISKESESEIETEKNLEGSLTEDEVTELIPQKNYTTQKGIR